MDWISFFQTNNIPFVSSGPNTSKGQVSIKCCWCGQADDSEHMSVSLEGKGFKCWRNSKHAGRNPARLIQALLNCSWEQATNLAGQRASLPNDFMNKVKLSLAKQEVVKPLYNLKLPSEFKKFSELPSCRMYLEYINKRGFTINDTFQYGVYYATLGSYKGRVLFTIDHDEKLVGWTGRTIFPTETLRYKSLTSKEDKAKLSDETPAPAPIGHFLLFENHCLTRAANTIVLCEGPMDAWKVNVLGKHLGVVSTCFFTSTPSREQINKLHDMLPRFKNRYLLLDQGTFSKTAKTRADLVSLGVEVKHMPEGVDDPGDFKTIKQLQDCLK